MPELLIPLLAAVAYLVATAGLVRSVQADQPKTRLVLWFALPAVALHAATHALGWTHLNGPDLHFFAALSLVALGMAALGTVAAVTQRMQALGVIVIHWRRCWCCSISLPATAARKASTGVCNCMPGSRCWRTRRCRSRHCSR